MPEDLWCLNVRGAVWTVVLGGAAADRCITCRRGTLEECLDGKRAKEFEDQQQMCSDSLPFCEVTVQEQLDPNGGDEEAELRDVNRGCVKEPRFKCDTSEGVRTCTATCRGDLCNDFEDVADRVEDFLEQQEREAAAREEREREEAAARRKWVIPVAVVVPLVVLAAVAACGVSRLMANRRKARDLKSGGDAGRPLNGDSSAPRTVKPAAADV
ncbi:uncharacterized protein LOC122363299 [Amphibalanus amphitrite]|uniref:uncharacterized protein LOC122363299 n=1 Tax=Amphibalanus amphitrite TaxID=1232801 RepID=UPI001C9245B4|nr:uncharacterized protein LOC122363299 [Amphibalanus amphitrite]